MKKFYEINLNEFLKEIAKRTLKEIEHTPMYEDCHASTHYCDLPTVVFNHVKKVILENPVSPDKTGEPKAYEFYIDRIFSVPHYGEHSGTELLKLICRCAFHDDVLTEAESISIINICHSEEWHKIFSEVNFNEGWN